MPFTLDNVIPWGRSMNEYIAMFDLSRTELDSNILSCADGPAGFNGEMHALGRTVASVDPLYQFSTAEIRRRIDEVYPLVMEQLRKNVADYVWTTFASPEELGKIRMKTMERFLVDLPGGINEGRYLAHSLPKLPFTDKTFDLALCSHFLFLYSEQLSTDFHCQSLQEMLRVAKEVRIFPLLTLERKPSPHFKSVCDWLDQNGYHFEIKQVNYEFQRGGNQMMRMQQK
jgi:hypothetical protein